MKNDRASSQSETIRLAVEAEIFAGNLRPGARIDEDAVAKRFQVSRTPVREALLKLEISGLVERLPRKGCIVARIDVTKLIMVFELMSELEGMCARLATRRMTEREKQTLSATHEASARALAANDSEAYYNFSHDFHMQLINGTHNEEIIKVANRIGVKLIPYRKFQLRYPGRSETNLRDHGEVLEAILAGQADRAGAVMKQHTTVQGDAMAEYTLMAAVADDEPEFGPQDLAPRYPVGAAG